MSNASEIRMYFKELLNDSMEHNRAELFAYARRRNPGANYTEGMMTGALKTLVDGNKSYICVGRGVYKLNVDMNAANGSYTKALIQKYNEILKETIEKMEKDIPVNPFLLLEAEEKDIVQMKKIQGCMDIIKDTIEYLSVGHD